MLHKYTHSNSFLILVIAWFDQIRRDIYSVNAETAENNIPSAIADSNEMTEVMDELSNAQLYKTFESLDSYNKNGIYLSLL